MNFSLSLTHDCNLECIYCYAGHKIHRVMSRETAMQDLEFGIGLSPTAVQLGFFGGEPLLEWDLLTMATIEAERLCREKGVTLQLTVTTNGTLLTRERAQWLKEHDFYPGLSIDGNQAMHDITRPNRGGGSSHAQTVKGLKMLQEFYPDLEVILVPDPRNIMHMTDSIRYLHDELKVKDISINPNFYTEWNDDALKAWERSFEEIGDYYVESMRRGDFFQINFI
ncbi:radical SAM protein, partial [Myxococcota bacterium]|nr:radical SAM protein [Myxococcota bacterium]